MIDLCPIQGGIKQTFMRLIMQQYVVCGVPV
jgi:hypothetical protein